MIFCPRQLFSSQFHRNAGRLERSFHGTTLVQRSPPGGIFGIPLFGDVHAAGSFWTSAPSRMLERHEASSTVDYPQYSQYSVCSVVQVDQRQRASPEKNEKGWERRATICCTILRSCDESHGYSRRCYTQRCRTTFFAIDGGRSWNGSRELRERSLVNVVHEKAKIAYIPR